jgi:ADP-heptose:LPS heptosyltransferase
MGIGDQIIATGLAKGAAAKGHRIAFGDGQTIIWDHRSAEIFRDNPNVAPPGAERSEGLRWVPHYRGHRLYNRDDKANQRWIWNYEFKAIPGEIYFRHEELEAAKIAGREQSFVVIEPNVPAWKSVSPNKQWPVKRFEQLAAALRNRGIMVRQFLYAGVKHRLAHANLFPVLNFRHALAALQRAKLVVTGEGGLHHGAAAVGTPAVVLFGGFIPPAVTGYDTHINLAHGEACGKYVPCEHCRQAMEAISFEQVMDAVERLLAQPEQKPAV